MSLPKQQLPGFFSDLLKKYVNNPQNPYLIMMHHMVAVFKSHGIESRIVRFGDDDWPIPHIIQGDYLYLKIHDWGAAYLTIFKCSQTSSKSRRSGFMEINDITSMTLDFQYIVLRDPSHNPKAFKSKLRRKKQRWKGGQLADVLTNDIDTTYKLMTITFEKEDFFTKPDKKRKHVKLVHRKKLLFDTEDPGEQWTRMLNTEYIECVNRIMEHIKGGVA
jgi:hypothetical protein